MRFLILALAGINIAGPAKASLLTFDFEDLSEGQEGALVSNGFVFDPGGVDWYSTWTQDSGGWIGHYHVGTAESKYFVFDYFNDESRLHVYGLAGQVFGVNKLDLAEQTGDSAICRPDLPSSVAWYCAVTFVGRLADSSTISKHVTLDGSAGFQTFSFDADWNHLTLFSIVADHAYLNPGLDNFLVQTVVEPSSLALLALGLTGLLVALALRGKERIAETAYRSHGSDTVESLSPGYGLRDHAIAAFDDVRNCGLRRARWNAVAAGRLRWLARP